MESEDMPDLMAVVAGGPAAVGTADDALDDADELEDLLEDALEQEFEEQDAGQATAVAPPAAPGESDWYHAYLMHEHRQRSCLNTVPSIEFHMVCLHPIVLFSPMQVPALPRKQRPYRATLKVSSIPPN